MITREIEYESQIFFFNKNQQQIDRMMYSRKGGGGGQESTRCFVWEGFHIKKVCNSS